ncbi:MAG: cytochrome P450 [Microbacterium sp.]
MTRTAFTSNRVDPYSPPEVQLRLQAEEPVAHLDWPGRGEVWTIAKHEDARAVLLDTRFSSDREDPRHPAHAAYNPATHNGQIIELDPPVHTRLRGRIMSEFTVKKIGAMRPRVEEVVSEAIDSMLASGSEGDLVELLALPVPSLVIADLLNVPREDQGFFQEHTSTFAGDGTPEERVAAIDAIRSYIAGMVDERIANPGDDILSRQLAAGATRDEAIGMGFLLLIAGHETTANQIALSIMTLLDKPKLLAQLREDITLVPGAVEELLRYFSIAESGGLRLATEDIEVRGVTIPEGATVWALENTANRDPDVFPDPHRIDFTRGSRNHLAFGFGPHQCLGQHVARLELEVVLRQVVERIPTLRLAVPVSELSFKNVGNFGPRALPVTW